ncbi:MAG: helix-turn-helix domain-containing protein [Tissierellia bacterium]|nr:helix-turn-helix domain-containing protein [Tissierellia bacterium]
MAITMGEKIKIILRRRNMTISDLSVTLGQSRQNLTNKITRDNFSEKELNEIADKLNCEFIGNFKMKDTNEII